MYMFLLGAKFYQSQPSLIYEAIYKAKCYSGKKNLDDFIISKERSSFIVWIL